MSIQLGPEWEQFNRRLGRTPQVMEQNIRRAMTASLLMIEADAKANVVQDTRRLAGSINHRIDGVYPRLVGSVGPSVRYGAVVEFGRRAGGRMPPVDALIGWVRRHFTPRGVTLGGAFQGRRRNRSWSGREAELRSRAFAVARAIQRRGIAPQPFMGPAFTRNRPRIETAFRQIGLRVTYYLAGNPIA